MPDEVTVDLVTDPGPEFEAMRAADPASGVAAGGEPPPDPVVVLIERVAELEAVIDALIGGAP